MPTNRTKVDREVKRAEILDVAEELLLRDGYEATTIASIARRVGVASNSVFWYFPSKDDLLAAVLERRQERVVASLGKLANLPLEEQVLGMLAELDQVAALTPAVHERAAQSPAVAEMHRRFHLAADGLLNSKFRDAGMSPADAARAAEAAMAMVEGIHLHEQDYDPAARDDLVLWVLSRLVGGGT